MLRQFLKVGAFLALLVGSASLSWGQAVRYDNILLNQSGKPVTNGQIQVCAGNVSTPVPCTPTTTVYADQALTQPITQPFSTGPLGNYGFWLPIGGTYTVSVSGKNITSLNFPITVGGSGGGGTPGGSDTQLQLNSHGNFAGSSSLALDSSTSPTQLNLGLDLNAKGPNPWVDIRAYGARATTISTTCTGSGTALTVSTTGFVNGDGIACVGGGATPSATTPTAPSVTPGEAETETVPNAYMTTGVSGASTYNYTIFAEDANGGLTAASPVTTITTGPAALGETSVTLSAISLTGNTLSITSSASHGMVANVLAHVTNTTAGDSPFLSGWFTFDTIGSGTTATSNHAMVYSASTVTGAGSLVYFVGNNITWSPVTGAVHYYVCAERPGDASYHIIGQALPTTTQFVDWGSTLSANPVIPWYVSSAQCTAASAQNDLYVGTVQSGGGTSSLTVSPSLTSNISGTSGRFDNEPAILAAMDAVATLGKLTAVYIPNGTFAINSPLTVPTNTAVLQAGTLAANASITASGSAINWTGELYKGSVNTPQFAEAGYPQIICNAYPCFTTYEGFSRLQFSGSDNSLLVYIHQNAWAANFDHTNFVTGGSNSDNMGIAVFTVPGVSLTSFSHSLFYGGPNQTVDQTWTPLFYQMGGSSGACGIDFNFVQWNRRGYYCQSNAGAPYGLQVRTSYRQGGITPMFAISNNSGNLGGTTILENVFGDTESQATVALTGVGGAVAPYIYLRDSNVLSVDAGGRPSNLTGNDSSGVNLVVGGEQIGGNFQGFTTTNGTFTATSPLTAPNPFVLTNGGFNFTLTGSPTANRTITFPDATGIMPLISGPITATHCAAWVSATQLGDAGAACGTGGGGGNVTGPASSTVDDLVGWNNTLGTLVKDEAIQVSTLCLSTGSTCFAPTTNGVQYVSSAGNDANSGTAPDAAHAKLTIPAAWAALPAGGGDIFVGAGITSWAGGTVPANVRIHFNTSAITLTAPIALSSNDGLFCAYGRQLDVSPYYAGTVFTLSGFSGTQDAVSGLQANGVTVSGCTFKMGGTGRRGIYLSGVSDAQIDHNTIVDPGEDGIRVDNGTQQSYNDTFKSNNVGHPVGDCFDFRTDAGTADLDHLNLADNSCRGRDPGGLTSSGTNAFHFLVPSGAASTQTIADVQMDNDFGHLSGTGVNEIYLDYEGSTTGTAFISRFWITGEYEGDEGGNTCTTMAVKDAAATNTYELRVGLSPGCSTYLTNVDATHVTGLQTMATDEAAANHNNVFSNIMPPSDNTDTLGLCCASGALDWANIFSYKYTLVNSGFLGTLSPATWTGAHTGTWPDANIVLPQPISSTLDTYLTALSGTTGAFSTSQIGQCIANGGSTITANYTLGAADRGCIARISGSGITLTIPQAGSGASPNWFGNNYYVMLNNVGSSSVTVSITTSTLSVNGGTASSSYTLPANSHVFIYSPDNTNYDGIAPPASTGSAWLQAHFDATSQTANIATTTLYTIPASPTENGYVLRASIACDSASASATITVTLKYTDPSGTVITNNQAQATCTTLGTASNGQTNLAISAQGGTNVTYSTTIANTPTYSVHIGLMGPY